MLELAVSKTKILLGVPEERLDSPSHRVQLGEMARWCVDLVRDNVFDTRFFILVARFLRGDKQLYRPKTAHIAFLGPDMIRFPIDCAGDCVDALAERIDTDSVITVRDAWVAFGCRDSLFLIILEVSDGFFRTIALIEEIGDRWDTCLDEFIDKCYGQFDASVCVFCKVEIRTDR